MSIVFSNKSANLFSTANGVVFVLVKVMVEDLLHACTFGVLGRSSRKWVER
jgi:hypothetical protein